MSETHVAGGQAPQAKHGPKGIDWDRGRVLFQQGMPIGKIAGELGCRRELVSRRASQENWRRSEASIHKRATDIVVAQAIDSRVAFLLRGDSIAETLMDAVEAGAEAQHAYAEAKSKKYSPTAVRFLSAALKDLIIVRRGVRGMDDDEGMGEKIDRSFQVTIRRLPATKPEYDQLKTVEGVPV